MYISTSEFTCGCGVYIRQVVQEFYNIFGPELKAVTGDPRHIEDVLKRVDALVKPIEEVTTPVPRPFPFRIRIGVARIKNWGGQKWTSEVTDQ